MSTDNILLGLVIAYFAWRILSSFLARRRIPALLQEGAQMVDVRTPGEFAAGHAPGSLNIPLQDLAEGARTLDPNRWSSSAARPAPAVHSRAASCAARDSAVS